MNTEQEYTLAEQKTQEILEKNPITRDSNKLFLIALMQDAGAELTTHQVNIIRDQMFAFETYTRAKRNLQERGYFPQSKRAKAQSIVKQGEVAVLFARHKRGKKEPLYKTRCWIDDKGMGHIERTPITV